MHHDEMNDAREKTMMNQKKKKKKAQQQTLISKCVPFYQARRPTPGLAMSHVAEI